MKGRVPRPREIEVTMLAYAPHFLGLAAAAAAEKLKLKNESLSAASNADGAVDTSEAKPDTSAAAKTARQKRSARRIARAGGRGAGLEGSASVPTGLSLTSVWPDEEAARKRSDVDKHRADPIRVGFVVRVGVAKSLKRINEG